MLILQILAPAPVKNAISEKLKHKLYDMTEVQKMLIGVDSDTQDRAQRERKKGILKCCMDRGASRAFAEIGDNFCDDLEVQFPNFKPMFERIRLDIALSKGTGKLRIRPILLLGSAGIGKTTVAMAIADKLNTEFVISDFSKSTTSSSLSGTEAFWGNSTTGTIFNALTKGRTCNPVFLLDEVDKASVTSVNGHNSPLNSLYSLLEENSAKMFQDLSIPLTIDASKIIYILTANSLEGIDKPLLSRMTVINIEQPTIEESICIAQQIYKKMVNSFIDYELESELSENVAELLASISPRLQKGLIEDAIARVIMSNRHAIEEDDLVFEKETVKRQIGFISNNM